MPIKPTEVLGPEPKAQTQPKPQATAKPDASGANAAMDDLARNLKAKHGANPLMAPGPHMPDPTAQSPPPASSSQPAGTAPTTPHPTPSDGAGASLSTLPNAQTYHGGTPNPPPPSSPQFTESEEDTVRRGQQGVRDVYRDYQESFDPKLQFKRGYRQSMDRQGQTPQGVPGGAKPNMGPLNVLRAAGRGAVEAGKARWRQHTGDKGGERLDQMIGERRKKDPGAFGPYNPQAQKPKSRWDKRNESVERQLRGKSGDAVERVQQGRAAMQQQWQQRQQGFMDSMFDYMNGVVSRQRQAQTPQLPVRQQAKKMNTMDDHLLKALAIRKNGGDSAAVAYLATELKMVADVSDAQADAIAKDALAGDIALYKALKEPSGSSVGDNSSSGHDPGNDPTSEDEPDDEEENPIKGKGTVVGELERPAEAKPTHDPMDRTAEQTANKASLGETIVGEGSEMGRDRRRELGSDEPSKWSEEHKCGDTPPEECACHGNAPKEEEDAKPEHPHAHITSYAKWAGRLIKNDDEEDEDDEDEYERGRRVKRIKKSDLDRLSTLQKLMWLSRSTNNRRKAHPKQLQVLQKLYRIQQERKGYLSEAVGGFGRGLAEGVTNRKIPKPSRSKPQQPGTPQAPADHDPSGDEQPQAPLDVNAKPSAIATKSDEGCC